MSLPSAFSSASCYFKAALDFLEVHAWIYQHANTRFMQERVLDHMPYDFVTFFMAATNEELNSFPLLQSSVDFTTSPIAVRQFREQLKRLIPASAYETLPEDSTPQPKMHKVSEKKQHEINKLSLLIHGQLEKKDATPQLLLDFGSGLGYLSSTLYERAAGRFLLLGFEEDEYRTQAARARLQADAASAIVYCQERINADSQVTIETAAAELLRGHGLSTSTTTMSIVGLHACADLSIYAMQLFLSMPSVRHLFIMPCCYHKLQLRVDGHTFIHFPLSERLQHLVTETKIERLLHRPFLRLAAQQTSARWAECTAEQHAAHGRTMFWRAAAELLAGAVGQVIPTQRGAGEKPIEGYADFCRCYALHSFNSKEQLSWSVTHARHFEELWTDYVGANERGYRLAEGLTCLQTTLQKLCENLVLYDRVCFLEEQGAALGLPLHAHCRKLLNEKLSPRCFVVIAEKLC